MGLLIGSNAVKSLYVGDTSVRMVYLGDTKVWPIGLPAGTVYNFEYTSQVQSIELPPGKYLLECWGAQGGTSYPDTEYIGISCAGSLGGYSHGILTLTETTTLYVFVGGMGDDSTTSTGYGGWNGGGATCGKCEYTNSDGYGISWPAAGGGATDIALVSSDMAHANGVTNRSLESLLSRIIVAGGGAGASSGYQQYFQSSDGDTEIDTTTIDQGSGGGIGGWGSYPGTFNSGFYFGIGRSLTASNYMHCGGAGGGGWYGGGTSYRDSDVGEINTGSGGSGFVNTVGNAQYRPNGYTGLLLDSGDTFANRNYEHGRAKITVLNESGENVSPQFLWSNQLGSWTPTRLDSAADGYYYTSDPLEDYNYAVIRCTFNNVTSITFSCSYEGENNYDYLTVGQLDLSCTRDSYWITLQGKSGTVQDITFACDKGEHFVEFCYSKDGSESVGLDNAQVYIKTYTL